MSVYDVISNIANIISTIVHNIICMSSNDEFKYLSFILVNYIVTQKTLIDLIALSLAI